ncbi:uncharacterized protein GGS25DRAFT_520990 [Hypoxylon fragiforme]|uniref:uncharacterized protein n=1 Tax=Hypoxylon fragiforme TaxID=63214 RepID=UPI0020C6964A|nr:uncharacterized protein GGS25DRAFT_520990 [Hypoxylon fragiforme]KAI2610181.1 hypothetical protein GGS25DRAFT_520990 [Hypoxylon fragiforme]
MPQSAPTPSLLLTKRLTAFLNSNLSPQIHTAVLTTLSGKLLAHASPHSVGTLRTQCTVAASIWAQYSSPAASAHIAAAVPQPQRRTSQSEPTPSAVTIQLSGGIMVVRRLRCGLLFVCVGPTAATEGTERIDHSSHAQGRPVPPPQQQTTGELHPTTPLGSPSEVESVVSTGAATTASMATTASAAASAAVVMRRQAEELARWLDDKLGSLSVLEEGLGSEIR